jgi:hypothetical protein
MKKIILMFFLTFTFFINLSAQWARTYGGSKDDYANIIQQTSDGGYIVAGLTSSFGAGNFDVWVLKLSSDGNIEWQRTYGGNDYDNARFLQQTGDGGYIVGGYTASFGAGYYDVWILKLSSAGNIEWQKTYGGDGYDNAEEIQQTGDGGYIVGGYTTSFSAGYYDVWILKLSSAGNIEWQKTYGGIKDDYAYSIQQTSDGGYIVAGNTWSFGEGQDDAWILKLNSTGDIEWQRTYGGSYRDCASTIRQTSDGGYIVAASTSSFGAGDWDFWILKLSSAGDIEWQRTYGGTNYDWVQTCLPISDGGYIVTGRTCSFGAGGYDAWILKLSSNGDISWQRTYGAINFENFGYPSVQQANGGGYIVTGYTSSFGAGGYDAWVLKVSSNGEILPSCGFAGTSKAIVKNSYAYSLVTYSYYLDPGASSKDTFVSPQDSDATVYLICPAQKYTLTISVSEGGTTDPAPGAHSLDEGTRVTVTAQPDSGYRFSRWSGDASGLENPLTVGINKDKSITANFVGQHTLTLSATEGGTINPVPGTYAYDTGTEVRIEATPDTGFRFGGWSGDIPPGSENVNPLMIAMDSDRSIRANFISQYKLTIAAGKGGTIEPSPGTYGHDSGAIVTIKAIPDSGYQFSGWSVDASGKDNPIAVTIDKDKWIVAVFSLLNEKEKALELKCFIATAAYGSPLHPYVKILRNFRDKCLMTNKLGRGLVKFYYRYSPGVADVIKKHRALKLLVRVSLLPMIAFSYSMLHLRLVVIGIIFSFISALSIFIVYFYLKRTKNSQ